MHSGVSMLAQVQLEAQSSRRIVVLGPPLIVEGLRSLGCDVVAATGFTAQLPVVALRAAPSCVVVHSDGRDLPGLERSLRAVRESLPACRMVVLLPLETAEREIDGLSALSCEVLAHDTDAVALQLRLGVGFAAPTLLTRREVDVLTLAAEGLSNHAIGRRLGLQMNTVKNYLRAVHRKLGATSRTEAVMIAARAGYPVIKLR